MKNIPCGLRRAGWGILMFFAVSLPVMALQSGDFTYAESGGAAVITGYTGAGGNVTIPGTLDGKWVVSIGDRAFSNNSTLTSVTIPSSVDYILSRAFSGCSGLTNVTIPYGVNIIGDDAFALCIGLTSVTIPSSVSSIGDDAFAYCSGLTSVTIPSSVTRIGFSAFFNCHGLTSVTIPSSVTSILANTFYNCRGLTSLTFLGNAPTLTGSNIFRNSYPTIYYTEGTTGWGASFGGLATQLVGYTPPVTPPPVTPPAEIPPLAISNVPDQSVTSGSVIADIPFTVGPAGATVTASSSNQVLVPDANIVLGGSGANRTVTIKAAVNESGPVTITLTASNGTGIASATFVLTIAPGKPQNFVVKFTPRGKALSDGHAKRLFGSVKRTNGSSAEFVWMLGSLDTSDARSSPPSSGRAA